MVKISRKNYRIMKRFIFGIFIGILIIILFISLSNINQDSQDTKDTVTPVIVQPPQQNNYQSNLTEPLNTMISTMGGIITCIPIIIIIALMIPIILRLLRIFRIFRNDSGF